MSDHGTRKSTCRHCSGEIIGPAESTEPYPEIWLHVSSGGTACHRVGFEQTFNNVAAPLLDNPDVVDALAYGLKALQDFKPKNRGQFKAKRVGLGTHPEGLDDL